MASVLSGEMSQEKLSSPTQVIHLAPGAQAVINGALISAREACTIEVSAGAYVLTGRALSMDHGALRNPCDELYFSLLDCVADPDRFVAERFRLFALLGEVAARGGPLEGQRECSQCAAALMAGDAHAAVQSAARMASSGLETARIRTKAFGPLGERRRTTYSGI